MDRSAELGPGEPAPYEPADALAEAARAEAVALESELAALESALKRVEEGHYGRCEVCGELLEDGWLEADPTARGCSAHLLG
jgi:DnaK suppressor protein